VEQLGATSRKTRVPGKVWPSASGSRRLPSVSVARIDVVVVSYNSREHLHGCVAPLARVDGVRVLVVDNASTDGSLETVANLAVTTIPQRMNLGFAHGCNVGWRIGSAPLVLFLNPDAIISPDALQRLAETLLADSSAGAAAPRILHDGALVPSLRRFPRLRSTYARAFFLHRLFPQASWTDEIVRDEREYERPQTVDWASGACLLVRRAALEWLGGFDDGFFLYCEEIDLCRRLRELGLSVRYEPRAACTHVGGASAPRSTTIPILTASRIRYARKHRGRLGGGLERAGIALEAFTHTIAGSGRAVRAAHARSLRLALRLRPREAAA
jgi:N-acetylglucosaminyl-diphospho-decaprenol L-rhamnosyltransferase